MLPGTTHIVFTVAGNHVLKVEMQQLVKMKSNMMWTFTLVMAI